MMNLSEIKIVTPDPIAEPVDDLQRPLVKILKHVFKIISPYFWGEKHTDVWSIGKFVAWVTGKNILDARCRDGRWLALPLPVYTSHFIQGPDYKRYNNDNIHPIMKRFAKPGTVAIDVGASCGQEIVTLSRAVGAQGQVYAFEPSFSFEALLRTVALNRLDNVVCIKAACGSQNGRLGSSADTLYMVGEKAAYNEAAGVPVLRLDDFLAQIKETRAVSLIKIDTDGFELEVIKGAVETIRTHSTHVISEFESHFDYSGVKGKDALNAYRDMGFSVAKIQTAYQTILPIDDEDYLRDMRIEENMIAHDIVLSWEGKK